MNFNHLSFISQYDMDHLKDMLISFDTIPPWEDMAHDEFITCLKKIQENLKKPDTEDRKPLQALIDLYLLSYFLLDENTPEWIGEELVRNIDVSSFFAGLPCHDDLISLKEKGRWQRVPVLVTSGETAAIRWFIAGFLEESSTDPEPLLPDWAWNLMDDNFLQGMHIAASQARIRAKKNAGTLVYYPLACAENTEQFKKIFNGTSASLPMALAFRSLLEDRNLSSHLVCTGSISGDGSVHAVGGLASKLKAAQNNQYQALVCPADNKIFSDMEADALIQVRTMDQAWMMVCLHEKENHRELVFARCFTLYKTNRTV